MPSTFADFLHFGETLLFTIESVSEWLFTRVVVEYSAEHGILINVAQLPNTGASVAELILGAGLVGFLGFRLAKFYTNLI